MNEHFVGISIDGKKTSFLYDSLEYEVEDSDIHAEDTARFNGTQTLTHYYSMLKTLHRQQLTPPPLAFTSMWCV